MQYWKLDNSNPIYKSKFGNSNIQHFSAVTDQRTKLGKVLDALIDEGQNVYLLLERGSWLSSEQIVVPLGEYRVEGRTIYLLSPSVAPYQQPQSLHEAASGRTALRGTALGETALGETALGEMAPDYEASYAARRSAAQRERQLEPADSTRPEATLNRTQASPELNTSKPGLNASKTVESKTIRLLEERLVVEQHRRKVGEVIVHKVVETQMVEVPVRRERLVVEQISPERKQLATIDLAQSSQTLQALEPGQRYQIDREAHRTTNGGANELVNHHLPESATVASTQQFLAHLAQRSQLAQAKLQLVFEDPELQAYYQRWLEQG